MSINQFCRNTELFTKTSWIFVRQSVLQEHGTFHENILNICQTVSSAGTRNFSWKHPEYLSVSSAGTRNCSWKHPEYLSDFKPDLKAHVTFSKIPSTKFHENPLSSFRAVYFMRPVETRVKLTNIFFANCRREFTTNVVTCNKTRFANHATS